ncbi:hypothetical protein K443DRAFT_521349 [Laccaria amethystina LaAM-08-1]|uniref:Uncharacterized protein n=1 Tax=Laccaria amethystina LaAM-08-1 TaxID=1095629 RepID=A0A0C9Y2W4_9AGAR|nr:hypothetical protein K443DRAFT_521349 [Laccaria amethystina LaAM-08-1]
MTNFLDMASAACDLCLTPTLGEQQLSAQCLLSLALIDMAKDSSQSSKQSKFSSRFNISRQPISPAPSEQSQGYPSKSRSLLLKLFSKSPSTTPNQTTSSLPLVSSTVDSRGKTALESSIATTPSGYVALAPLPEARTPASFSVVQDQPKSSAQQAKPTTTSPDQSHGLASKPPENRQTAPKPGSEVARDRRRKPSQGGSWTCEADCRDPTGLAWFFTLLTP